MVWDGTISFTPTTGPSHGTAFPFEISFAPVTNEPQGQVSVRHIPGSGVGTSSGEITAVDYVDIGGQLATFTVSMKLFFPTAAAYFTYRAACYLQTGTLIYFDPLDSSKTSYTAILQKLNRTDRNVSVQPAMGTPPNWGETHADAEWLVTAVNA